VPGPNSAFPQDPFVHAGGLAYFGVGDEFSGGNVELWRSDGTAQGTQKVREINPSASSNPRSLTPFGNELLFVADDGSSGFELYRSDGTAAGTVRVIDLFAGPGSGFRQFASHGPQFVVDAIGRIVLSALDGTPGRGRDLFVSDGTEAGTRRVSPSSSPESIQPHELLALADGGVLFAGYTAASGREPWFSDGSDAGTFAVADIAPGSESGGPQQLTATSDGAIFAANDGSHGLEPWRVVLTREITIFADGFDP
jgi:ELWxxDGT repeat protein